jgi:hypothetical protein
LTWDNKPSDQGDDDEQNYTPSDQGEDDESTCE